jgi:hypothetical protein
MKRIATLLLLLVLPALTAQAQSKQAVIRLKNESSLLLTAKLVGPTPKAARLRTTETFTFRVQPGEYRLLYQFHASADTGYFLKTDSFSVRAEDDVVSVRADITPNDMGAAYSRRYQIPPIEFVRPRDWPADGVPVDEHAGFNALKVLATVGELYLDEDSDERTYVTSLAKALVNRRLRLDVLTPLRKQGFKTTFAWIANQQLPRQFSEPTLLITYEESEGRRFQIGTGVYVALRFSLYGTGSSLSDPVWEEEIGGTNDERLRVNILNANASFRANSMADLGRNLDFFGLDLTPWKQKPQTSDGQNGVPDPIVR